MTSTARDRLTVDEIGARRRARLAREISTAAALTRASDEGYGRWLDHVSPAAGCANPVKLSGTVYRVETSTGRITSERHTSEMPDGLIYTA